MAKKVDKEKQRLKKKESIMRTFLKLTKKLKRVATFNDLEEAGVTRNTVRWYFQTITKLEEETRKKYESSFPDFSLEKERLKRKDEIMRMYANLTKSLKRRATFNDMKAIGISREVIRQDFNNLTGLESAARDKYGERFHDISLNDILGPKALHKLDESVREHDRFFITTAITGCAVDSDFLKSVKNYCEKNDAELLVLVASDPAKYKHMKKKKDEEEFLGSIDRELMDAGIIVMADAEINSNLHLSTIKLSAKQIDPITGLDRLGQRNGSFIYASPKQRMKPVPVSNEKLPHVLMTTGAITLPDYTTRSYMSERTGTLADHDHVMGGIIVEVVDDEIFHYRQVQADKNGSFIDMGVEYKKNGKTRKVAPEALVMGDWHSGSTDPTARDAWFDICKRLGVKRLVVHDGFDGRSINHHERHNVILRAQRAVARQNDLIDEVKVYADDLNTMSKIVKEVVVVKSNHDEVLKRWLQDGEYVKDPLNHRYALDLAAAMMDGEDPLKWAVESLDSLDNPNSVIWLDRDEDFIIGGVQLGAHGDKGANGARGSLRAMERSYGNSITGHSHAPEILRGAWQVGTSSYLKLSYNEGPSSWFHTSCILYANGSRQLINSINGDYRDFRKAFEE